MTPLRLTVPLVLAILSAVPARGDVVASEFFSDPLSEGWNQVQQWCGPIVWAADGLYHQDLDQEGCPGDVGDQDSWRRPTDAYNGHVRWYYEFRVSATGGRSEIVGGAPAVLAAFNAFGLDYTATVASDQVKLFRDASLPIVFLDLQPALPHSIRIELDNTPPASYRWYVDGVEVDAGFAEGPFPANDASVTWRGRAWHLTTVNRWDYIRFGDIPPEASGDFDSSGAVDAFDVFYFDECLARSAAGEAAAPSCAWADMDSDNDVDCDDADQFQQAWAGPGDPPILPACFIDPIPAVSNWGAVVLTLLVMTAGTFVFRNRRHGSPHVHFE